MRFTLLYTIEQPLDESGRLYLESLAACGHELKIFAPQRLGPWPFEKINAYQASTFLPDVTRFQYQRSVMRPILAGMPADACLLTMDWQTPLLLNAREVKGPRLHIATAIPERLTAKQKKAYAKRGADQLIVVPNKTVVQELHSWLIPMERLHIQPPLVPIDANRTIQGDPAAATALSAAGFLVGIVSPLASQQGLETVIQAIQNAGDIIPDLKVFIIGDGPDKRRFLWLLEQTHLKSRVQIAANAQDYRRFLQHLDVCIAGNIHDQGFNPVVAHSQAAGAAIIATDLPGHQEMIEHGKTGLLYTPGNSHMLAQHLMNLYTHRDWLDHYKQSGPALVADRYGSFAKNDLAKLLAGSR